MSSYKSRGREYKMFVFFKSLSGSVHDEEQPAEAELKNNMDLNDDCTSLTVWRKSLITSCNGFTVIDTNGNLVYRVDNYMVRPQEVILMDGAGKSLLTMRRRKVIFFNNLNI